MTKGYHDSKTPESIRDLWRTPKAVFDFYNTRFNFKLDLAASKDNHLCKEYMTIEDDALDPLSFLSKSGYMEHDDFAVWCNPPYSNLMPWVQAALTYSQQFDHTVVMLLPADTSVKWFKLAFDNCTECHLISGRLAFINEETGKPVSGNNKGSVVFIFDPHSPVKSHTVIVDRDEIMGVK